MDSGFVVPNTALCSVHTFACESDCEDHGVAARAETPIWVGANYSDIPALDGEAKERYAVPTSGPCFAATPD